MLNTYAVSGMRPFVVTYVLVPGTVTGVAVPAPALSFAKVYVNVGGVTPPHFQEKDRVADVVLVHVADRFLTSQTSPGVVKLKATGVAGNRLRFTQAEDVKFGARCKT